MSWFFSAIPYLLAAGTIALGVLMLLKDWQEYKNPRLRKGVVFALILIGTLQFVTLYLDREDKKRAAADISRLSGQVQAATDALKRVSGQVSDLKTDMKTGALQKKLAGVQAELQNTQKALAPGPKAELVFTFAPFPTSAPGQPLTTVTDVALPVNREGSVHVEFNILNPTKIDAVDVEINVQICNGCKYAREPLGLSKLPGLADTQRHLFIRGLLAQMAYQTLSVDVIPPSSDQALAVGFEYRCRTCILPTEPSKGIVRIAQP